MKRVSIISYHLIRCSSQAAYPERKKLHLFGLSGIARDVRLQPARLCSLIEYTLCVAACWQIAGLSAGQVGKDTNLGQEPCAAARTVLEISRAGESACLFCKRGKAGRAKVRRDEEGTCESGAFLRRGSFGVLEENDLARGRLDQRRGWAMCAGCGGCVRARRS